MPSHSVNADASISGIDVSAYTIPTDAPESDGTLEWDSTTLVAVRARADGVVGFGYTYAHASVATLIHSALADVILGENPLDIPALWQAQFTALRNHGQCGLGAMAVSAVDTALWDLKGKLLNAPVALLLGRERERVDLYGSGGFTSYSDDRLRSQLQRWTDEEGMRAVKIKVGRHPDRDVQRAAVARDAIGDEIELLVDANSAYDRKQALDWMERFAGEFGVTWMEEPLDPNDLQGLRFLRDQGPAGMEVADGEYGWTLPDFRRFAEAGAVDVMMADLTRCGGITGLLRVAALCQSYGIPLSTHCAPALHLHACCAIPQLRHCEYFHDHARIESMLLDGCPTPTEGSLAPDLSRPGLGLELKDSDAEPDAV